MYDEEVDVHIAGGDRCTQVTWVLSPGKRRFCLVGCCDENAAILYAMLFSNVIIYTWVAIFNSSEKRLQTEASEYDM